MTGAMRGYYMFSVWAIRLFTLNCLWIGFTILGFGMFGLMPATTAMFAVTRKWVIQRKEEVPIFRTFWTTYKKSFLQTNLHGIFFLLVGYLLLTEFRITQAGSGTAYTVAMFATVGVMLIFGMVLLYFFPIYVHFRLSNFSYIKWSLLIGMIHPVLTIFLIVAIGAVVYFMYISIPILIFLFGGSVTAYFIMWAVSKTFRLYEKRESVTAS
ncbi:MULTISPECIES: DUF624 domain-containing protein [Clostridia]|uniref:YesL family protein n=1 Tax=Clostridia TaxID=186801 RepID=UPI000EA1B557|nr:MULTISPECIES: DUF624 domain-containing protein [Clostridia]NBJ68858.1 DUF624 domain-containing protein [Roseburia sp. 1XD42-34]RKI80234.1 DUF624 domain-containing protein [Clostridium sp. 1xD42-85]